MRLSLAVLLFTFLTRTSADPDLWGHLPFGRDIVQMQTVPDHDPYSFTSDKQWINHEWLAEVLMYGSYAWGGHVGLVAFKAALLLAMLGMIMLALHGATDNPVVHDLFVFLAVAGTYGRTASFRPQVFSLVLFSALLSTVVTAERGRPRALLVVPLIFLMWANLHGGWIVGLAAFGIWSAWSLVRADQFSFNRAWLVTIGVASVLATLVNPYGWRLWDFLGETVRFSRDISDWQPLWILPFGVLTPWLTATVLAIVAFVGQRRDINPAHLGIVTLYWVSSIRVSRLDAFFILSVIVLLAPHISAMYQRTVRRGRPAMDPVVPIGIRRIVLAILAIGTIGIILSRHNFECVAMDGAWEPEPQAVPFVKQNALQGRMLTYFDWGEYAIWHFAPDVKVSMDGRRETVYSEELLAKHFNLYLDRPGATSLVAELNPDYIWLPTRLTVLPKLERDGWVRIFSGPKSTILGRQALGGAPSAMPTTTATLRCFPDP